MKDIQVHLWRQSDPIEYTNVFNTYQKGLLFCVGFEEDGRRKVDKFFLPHIFRISEPY